MKVAAVLGAARAWCGYRQAVRRRGFALPHGAHGESVAAYRGDRGRRRRGATHPHNATDTTRSQHHSSGYARTWRPRVFVTRRCVPRACLEVFAPNSTSLPGQLRRAFYAAVRYYRPVETGTALSSTARTALRARRDLGLASQVRLRARGGAQSWQRRFGPRGSARTIIAPYKNQER